MVSKGSVQGRPFGSRLDEHAKGDRGFVDRQHRSYRVGRGVDHGHGAVAAVHDVKFSAIGVTDMPDGELPTGIGEPISISVAVSIIST